MNLTPRERFAVVVTLVEEAARQRQHHGPLVDRLTGEGLMLKPIELEQLAQRIEQETDPNGDLIS
jgi:hypothetical protein